MKRLCTLLVALLFLASVFAMPVAAESDPIIPDAPGASADPSEPDPVAPDVPGESDPTEPSDPVEPGEPAEPTEPDAPAVHPAFDEPVRHSVTDSHLSGWGLAFCFTLNIQGVAVESDKSDAPALTNATVVYEGEQCPVTRIGTLITNRVDLGEDSAVYLRSTALDDANQVKDVSVARLYAVDEESCTYAVRITNIPLERDDRLIYTRPYVEITCGGETVTLYGAIDSSSYVLAAQNPGVELPDYGAGIDVDNRMTVGETAVLCDTAYVQVVDELDDWIVICDPERPNYIYYACYDANGKKLSLKTEDYGKLKLTINEANASETFAIALPEGTARLEITGHKILFWSDWEM